MLLTSRERQIDRGLLAVLRRGPRHDYQLLGALAIASPFFVETFIKAHKRGAMVEKYNPFHLHLDLSPPHGKRSSAVAQGLI